MKIGILTVHRALNYGSVLQCYALQEYLRKLGHEVWVIDYRQRWVESVDRVFSFYYVWHFLKKGDLHAIVGNWRTREVRRQFMARVDKVFGSFLKKLHLTSSVRYRMPKGFDIYMIGSDQLWSHQCIGGEDRFYLGNFSHSLNSKIIGYALSASTTSLNHFGANRLKCILSNFDKITVREQENSDLIFKLTGIRLPVAVDPVLLTDESFWNPMVNHQWKNRNYIVIYQVRHLRGKEHLLLEKAQKLASIQNCEIIDLSLKTYSVEDFVSIIKYARCVISTSFHAIVFSIIMETPCYAIQLHDGLDVRYVDLLSKLGLEKELVEVDFEPVFFTVDFHLVKEQLAIYRQQSVEFLDNISNDEKKDYKSSSL